MSETSGVKTLLGDPKKAVLRLAIPMMFAMFIHAVFNIVDGMWVSGIEGKGDIALAGIGLFFPLFMTLMAIGFGIGTGGGSTISRMIGAHNKEGADKSATITLILGITIAVLAATATVPFLKNILFALAKDEKVATLSHQYGKIILTGAPLFLLVEMCHSILRGEGDSKRAMISMIVSSVSNIILDPIFIYTFDLGIAGAAYATVVSYGISALLCIYWLFIKRDTHVSIALKHFVFDKLLIGEILKVGIPSAFSQISISISIAIVMGFIVKVGGAEYIAVYTASWRIIALVTIPVFGIATSVTSVCGAAYGSGDREKLIAAFYYGVRLGFIILLSMSAFVIIFVEQIAHIFTWNESSSYLKPMIVELLIILAPSFPVVPLGMVTTGLFRGAKRGDYSLYASVLRTIVAQPLFSFLFGIALTWGIRGIWIGLTVGNVISVSAIFLWGIHFAKRVELPQKSE